MWHGIEGHDDVVEQFRRALGRGRMATTFLFVGPSGVGKRTFALKLAEALLCQTNRPETLDPCGRCDSCRLFEAGNHPDLIQVAKPAGKSDLPIELLIGSKERRGQEGLCHDLWQKPQAGSRRIAIVDDADSFNDAGANALLKTLEEPPPGAVIILIATSAETQLPTIRSRAQMIRFLPLSAEIVERLLIDKQLVANAADAHRLAAHAEGSLERALTLHDGDYWTFRSTWLGRLAETPFDSLTAAKSLIAFVDAAGKEPSARRNRAKQVIDLTIDFFVELARVATGAPSGGDTEIRTAAERLAKISACDEETAVRCAERSLDARDHLERYANQGALLECWLDDLAREQALAASNG